MAYLVAACSVPLTKKHLCNEISISDTSRAYYTYGGEERFVEGVGGET
jgi:hypothetical protein